VARLLGAQPGEILFTSGGTESDNLAVIGAARARVAEGAARHVITTAVEHPAVDEACRVLEEEGFRVDRVRVDAEGRVRVEDLASALQDDTALVSVMHANNETGALMPVPGIAAHCRRRGVPLHSDAAQSVGKVPVRVDEMGVDLLTVAGHKLYGPKGVGALYRRRGTPLRSFLVGAGHEGGLRAGTENVPGIVGLGSACDLAERELGERVERCRALRDRLEERLRSRLPEVVLLGPREERLPNTLYVSIPGADANALLGELSEEVAASAGAACHAEDCEASAVLSAMGIAPELARCALRLSVGRENDEKEIDRAAERVAAVATHLRRGAAAREGE
jgi:cysteine desulfurase